MQMRRVPGIKSEICHRKILFFKKTEMLFIPTIRWNFRDLLQIQTNGTIYSEE